MVKIKGKLLDFDRIDSLGYVFPKDCKITYAEKLPIIWDFKPEDPSSVLGNCKVIKTETGLEIEGELTDKNMTDIIAQVEPGTIGLGGFYNHIKSHKHKDLKLNINNETNTDIRIIDSAILRYVSLTLKPVFDDYTFKKVGE